MMERDANQVPEVTTCRSGCGFYGSSVTDGMCSKCYKDTLKRKQSAPSAAGGRGSPTANSTSNTEVTTSTVTLAASDIASISAASIALPVVGTTPQESTASEKSSKSDNITEDGIPSSTDADLDSSTDSKDSSQKDKKKKNRCCTCRKKIGLTGFECRCGGQFCSLHRYSDKHECTFNYKELGASEIRKNNPVVVGEKIQKI